MSLMGLDTRAPKTPPRGEAMAPPPISAQEEIARAGEDFAPTLIRRLKDHLIPQAKDKRLGTVLGIMHLEGVLSEVEVEAGFCYAADVGAYERMKGHPARHSQSPSFEFGRKGVDGLDLDALERMDPDVAAKLRKRIARRRKTVQKRYDRAQSYIPLSPILICTLVEEVCCNDRRVHSGHHPVVKKILRNLAERCYGLVRLGSEEAARKKPISRKADASLVATAAVDALEQWFATRNAKVTEFGLHGLTLTAVGHAIHGEVLDHTIRLKRSGLMAETISAQIVRAAEAKGWQALPQRAAEVEVTEETIRAGIMRKE